MRHLLALSLLLSFSPALAQNAAPPTAQKNAPAESESDREKMKKEVLDQVRKEMGTKVNEAKEEMRDEVRAQLATSQATKNWEEEWQEEKKKLELLELDGYLRFRPDLFWRFDLGRGADPTDRFLFPPPILGGKTIASGNMRFRIDPVLNVSEDVRIKAQIDIFDDLVLGSTPEGGFGLSDRTPMVVFSQTQLAPSDNRNSNVNSIQARRAWAEILTPIGMLRFGRMASHWGLGILANDGNGINDDYGDSPDRVMFITKIPSWDLYVVPAMDFVAEGPTSLRRNEFGGQPFDRDNRDDARNYILAISRRSTEKEARAKIDGGGTVWNGGFYGVYRTQTWDANDFYKGTSPYGGDLTKDDAIGFVRRDAWAWVPDLWFKVERKELRVELEAAYIGGRIGNRATSGKDANNPTENQRLDLNQLGAVAQGEYRLLNGSLKLGLELGFASGDKAFGMGNYPGASGGNTTVPGQIEGQQFDCSTGTQCADNKITNFRFNRAYRVDLILWREIFNGITDAIYTKPSLRYEIADGLSVNVAGIYSRTVFKESSPSSDNNNLGIELDSGLNYDSNDGFIFGVAYGVLFPLAGLDSTIDPQNRIPASTAQTVRGFFAVKY